MILYNASSSYYSMIARLALLEAGAVFQSRRMDIHIAQEQLTPWYLAINPAMTVPAMTDDKNAWTDSRDILKYAADASKDQWLDADITQAPHIEHIVDMHYGISIEDLTFGKAMQHIFPLRFVFPRMLTKIIKTLEAGMRASKNPKAIEAKIDLDRRRLTYFTKGNQLEKLENMREIVKAYLKELPVPGLFLFGDKPSSADIVTIVLLARLKMIGEFNLVPLSSPLVNWFERMQARPAYKEADIWTHFQFWRILLKR